jgi:hypothetical protein
LDDDFYIEGEQEVFQDSEEQLGEDQLDEIGAIESGVDDAYDQEELDMNISQFEESEEDE